MRNRHLLNQLSTSAFGLQSRDLDGILLTNIRLYCKQMTNTLKILLRTINNQENLLKGGSLSIHASFYQQEVKHIKLENIFISIVKN